MGILNTTPDSFYDGGLHDGAVESCRRVDALLEQGADIIDIGGESSRPGAPVVSAALQLERVTPALVHAVKRGARVSIDTTNPEVAERALSLGASIVNDVSCLRDEGLAKAAHKHGATLIVTHCRQPMQKMEGFSKYPREAYSDVVSDVQREWLLARARAEQQGVARERIWFDPGLGFCKNAEQSLELLARPDESPALGAVAAPAPRRKPFIGGVDGSRAQQRLGGSIAASLVAVQKAD
jgi:dihydropteroate synthase